MTEEAIRALARWAAARANALGNENAHGDGCECYECEEYDAVNALLEHIGEVELPPVNVSPEALQVETRQCGVNGCILMSGHEPKDTVDGHWS